MNQANITMLLTLAKTGQPKGYAGSEMMQADLDAVLSVLVSVDSVNTSPECVDETANYRHEQAEQEHSADTGNMVFSKPSVFDGICCGCSKKAADGWALYCVECWEKAEQRRDSERMEPVAYLRMGSDQRFVVTKAAEELLEDTFHELYTHPVRTKDLTQEEIDRLCAAIKAEDDYCVDNGDYMLDSNDCIKIIRGEWVRPDYNLDNAVIAADREKNK